MKQSLAENGNLQVDIDDSAYQSKDLVLPNLNLPTGDGLEDADDDGEDGEDDTDELENDDADDTAEAGKGGRGKNKATIQADNSNCCYLLCGAKDYKKGDIWGYKEKEGYSCIVPKSNLDSGKSCDKPVASCSM